MDSTERFSNRVENYVKYRPSYPKKAINYLLNNGINKDSIIGDIGSGTGILSNLLVNQVKTLYGVEPNDAMRSYSEKILTNNKNFISINATAENTTLENNSLDAITVAQAFHWFNKEKCKVEFKRILKDDGKVFLLWNNRLKDTTFLQKYDEILINQSTDYNNVNHQNLADNDFNYFFNNNWETHSFENYQLFNFEQFIGRVFSSSYTPEEKDPTYPAFYNALKDLFDKENKNGIVKFSYTTDIISGTLN